MSLSLLCVTSGSPSVMPILQRLANSATTVGAEFVLCADGQGALEVLAESSIEARVQKVQSVGYVESVLDEAIAFCTTDYVLRLDDDELASEAMVEWLRLKCYEEHDHWKFPRLHLWPDAKSVLYTDQLFPDWQTRLSTKAKSVGRSYMHAGSPFGGGVEAPVAIEHHKFLVRTREEREETFRKWHGGTMQPFSLPEDVYQQVRVVDAGIGFVPWTPKWEKTVEMRMSS